MKNFVYFLLQFLNSFFNISWTNQINTVLFLIFRYQYPLEIFFPHISEQKFLFYLCFFFK
jgi:hypothetical protein